MDGSIRIGEHRKDGLKLSFCFSVIKSKLQKKEKGVMIVYARIKKSSEKTKTQRQAIQRKRDFVAGPKSKMKSAKRKTHLRKSLVRTRPGTEKGTLIT